MPRRHPFHPARRVPDSFPRSHLRRRLLPLVLPMTASITLGALADLPLPDGPARDRLTRLADRAGTRTSEASQRLYFDEPGLDTLTVRAISSAAARLSTLGRAYLRTRIRLGLDATGRAATMLPLVPRAGFDSLMVTMLAVGSATGHFRGGPVHTHLCWDSADPDAAGTPMSEGHARPRLTRLDTPRSLTDMAADIDDLYWALASGQVVKITRVGTGEERRWLVSLPGTDHLTPETTANPADTESNIREVLGLPSSMRVGLQRALDAAMDLDGVPEEQRATERVLVCGHSQGGMVAATLASMPIAEAGVTVDAVLALGAPNRRTRVRDDVTMVSVAHDQDVIPSTDGTAAIPPDHRVTVGRRLVRPRRGPLYYAHSSTTYTETVRQLERKCAVAPWGRVAAAVGALRNHLPREGEETRVTIHEIWQEVLPPLAGPQWDRVVALDLSRSRPAVAALARDGRAGAARAASKGED